LICLIFLGGPGSGKGTQAKILAQSTGLKHISTGDILRSAIKEETKLGVKAQEFVDAGKLVPDEIILDMIREELTKEKRGIIFDGFPRTVPQAEGLDNLLSDLGGKVSRVINLDVDDQVIINRLVARRICRVCGAEFNINTKPPAKTGICDFCGGELYQRSDDNADVIKNRINIYRQKTMPLEGYYRSKGLMAEIEGSREFEEVTSAITEAIGSI